MMAQVLDTKAAGARRFEGQVAVVTGGGQGIGAATARRLAQEGASIVIGDMVAETSERVRQAIRELWRVVPARCRWEICPSGRTPRL